MSAVPRSDRRPVVATIGMATLDYLYVVDEYPGADTVTPAHDHATAVGGAAGRGAVAARRLGAETRLLASCGTGVHAQVLTGLLDAEDVQCTWIAYDQPSQHSAVVIARREATRTILWLPQPMADARMVEHLPTVLDGADVALIDSTDERLATAAFDECERRGVATVFDTGSGRPWTRELLRRADHVIAPEKFALKETGRPAEPALAELLTGARCAVLAVTRGAAGGVYVSREQPRDPARWDAAPVTAVDSNGAGDTFHGAYAWALARGLPTAACFETAAWSAALKATRLGNGGVPTLAQLERARSAAGGGERA